VKLILVYLLFFFEIIHANTIGAMPIQSPGTHFFPAEIKVIEENITLPKIVAQRFWRVRNLAKNQITISPVFIVDGKFFNYENGNVVDPKNVFDLNAYDRSVNHDKALALKLSGELEFGYRFDNGWTYLSKTENGHALIYRINGSAPEFMIVDYKDFKMRMLEIASGPILKSNDELSAK